MERLKELESIASEYGLFKPMEKAEKKIEIIVKLREAINSGVQDAVVRRGTEFMTSAQEAGSL